MVFASAKYGVCFTIQSFAKLYSKLQKVEPAKFAKVLWGNFYYNKATKKFMRKPQPSANAEADFSRRTFVEFILEPLYKIMAHTVSKEKKELRPFLLKLGIYLRKEDYKVNTKKLLRLVCRRFFGNASSIVDMVKNFIPSPVHATRTKVGLNYTGNRQTEIFKSL